MELNREQIIKALECCKFGKDEAKCKECNWHPWIKPRCWRLLASNALALIIELTEENERLRAEKSELLNEFMNWLQDNEHINKSVEYRNELCEMFLNDRRLNK